MINVQYSNNNKIYFGCTICNKLVAFALISIDFEHGYNFANLISVNTNSKYKNRNYGSKLIKYIVYFLKNKKYKFFTCNTISTHVDNFSLVKQNDNLSVKIIKKILPDKIIFKFRYYMFNFNTNDPIASF